MLPFGFDRLGGMIRGSLTVQNEPNDLPMLGPDNIGATLVFSLQRHFLS